MGLFKKKKSEKENQPPKLPPLPQTPNFQSQNNQLAYPPEEQGQYSEYPEEQYQDEGLQYPPEEQGQYQDESSPLPAFPESNIGEQMNQNTIKDAVTEPIRAPQKTPLTKGKNTIEITGEEPQYQQNVPMMQEIKKSVTTPIKPTHRTTARKEPLFIQLDKFENTIASFNQIKLQISEIETLLKSIKETRAKEQEDLNNWEEQIEQIRMRLDKIDQEIFSQI